MSANPTKLVFTSYVNQEINNLISKLIFDNTINSQESWISLELQSIFNLWLATANKGREPWNPALLSSEWNLCVIRIIIKFSSRTSWEIELSNFLKINWLWTTQMFQRAKINEKGQGRAYKMHNHVRMTSDKNVVCT